MSQTHPKYDICDYHSKLNAYGKGKGVYPKAKAPKPPYHPHCRCVMSPRIDLDPPKSEPLTNKSASREFILSMPKRDAIAILGSEAKYFEYRENSKLSVLDIVDKGKPKGYETRFVGDVVYNDNMKSMYFGRSLQPAKPITNLDDSAMKARDIVVSAGIASGNEHGVAVSVATGDIVQQFTSDKPDGIAIPQFSEKVVIHHNHPLGDGFSKYDMLTLITRSDIVSVYANGHENQYAYAVSSSIIDPKDADRIVTSAISSSRMVLAELIDLKGVNPPNGASLYLFGLILKKRGVIDDYDHNPPYDIDNFIKLYEDDINKIIKELM